jgi:hypothetical protein
MAFFILLVIMFWMIALVNNQRKTSTVIRCHSSTCGHNKKKRCTKTLISVYDNPVWGMCFDHTQTMRKRVIEPMAEKGMTFKSSQPPPETPTVPVKNFKPWTSRKEKLDWWLN